MPQIIKNKTLSQRSKPKSTQRSKVKKIKSTLQSKKVSLVPAKVRPKSSTPDYYNCLLNYAQQGFYDAQAGKKLKIHACCKKCKLTAPNLNSQRDKELVKLITSYKQVGESLAKLLKPIN